MSVTFHGDSPLLRVSAPARTDKGRDVSGTPDSRYNPAVTDAGTSKAARQKGRDMGKATETRRTAGKKAVFELRGTGRRDATKGKLAHLAWNTLEMENVSPLFQRQLVVGQNVMVARILLKKGCVVPLHSHHNEQVSYVLKGSMKFWIDSKEIIVRAGEVLTIPPHMPHKAEALEDTIDLDVFDPPRADWINKTDQYLRGGK
jgi:quercetin dioxygenase-like cupin family protein